MCRIVLQCVHQSYHSFKVICYCIDSTKPCQLYCHVVFIVTRCNTLQHTVTHCNTLQHTATHCNTLQQTSTHCNTLQHTATHCNTLQHTATHIHSVIRTIHTHTHTWVGWSALDWGTHTTNYTLHTRTRTHTCWVHSRMSCSAVRCCNVLQRAAVAMSHRTPYFTGCRRTIECLKLQSIFCKRVTAYWAVLRKMTYKNSCIGDHY